MKALMPLKHVKVGDRIEDSNGHVFTVTSFEHTGKWVTLSFDKPTPEGFDVEFSEREVLEVER